jgi:hypothetical protein
MLIVEILVSMVMAGVFALGANGRYIGVVISPFELISAVPKEASVPRMGLFLCLAISLSSAAAGSVVWMDQVVVYWREASSGHSPLAFFIGVATAQLYRIFLCALHFACIYSLIIAPLIPYINLVCIVFLLEVMMYGVAAFIVWTFGRSNAALLAVILGIIFSVCNGYIQQVPAGIQYLFSPRWATEAMFGMQAIHFENVMQVIDISSQKLGYSVDAFSKDMALEFVTALFWWVVAYFAMVTRYRSKQR